MTYVINNNNLIIAGMFNYLIKCTINLLKTKSYKNNLSTNFVLNYYNWL